MKLQVKLILPTRLLSTENYNFVESFPSTRKKVVISYPSKCTATFFPQTFLPIVVTILPQLTRENYHVMKTPAETTSPGMLCFRQGGWTMSQKLHEKKTLKQKKEHCEQVFLQFPKSGNCCQKCPSYVWRACWLQGCRYRNRKCRHSSLAPCIDRLMVWEFVKCMCLTGKSEKFIARRVWAYVFFLVLTTFFHLRQYTISWTLAFNLDGDGLS